jgi:Zn-dependent peptidase ImmA (M78 family)
MTQVAVKPEMLRWARERARIDEHMLADKFPKLSEWESGDKLPTLKQLEKYAHATYAPIGFLFLSTPPEERMPIPDFRTMANQEMVRPSPNLLETIYTCQQRQSWYRDYAQSHSIPPLDFIGSATLQSSVVETAEKIRQRLGFDLNARRDCPTWAEALRLFISEADAVGIMVMCSGVVLNNNYRKLNPEEFRGFAISDPLAPLVFINGADTKAAQMFTLAHELAHLWLGQTALSNSDATGRDERDVETWCNRVAAELLVPLKVMRDEIDKSESIEQAMQRLARLFKVSTLVILRRLFDIGMLTQQEFWAEYKAELARIMAAKRPGSGGNFYLSQAARISKRFARALVESTLEGQTLYRDAMKMVGISKVETFNELGRSLGYPI